MPKGFTTSFRYVRNAFGFIARRGSSTLLLVSIVLCHVLSAEGRSRTFDDRMSKILSQPSQHGKKLPLHHSLRALRAKRDADSGNFLYEDDSDYYYGGEADWGGVNTCRNFSNDDLERLSIDLYKGPVCDIIDARGSATQMKDLENCTIVNGFVHLVFMHNLTKADLEKYRFPKLRMITHYLLIFRMYNLRSLRDMFPNLAVIDGQELFKDYALVIYENPHLQEIGLKNLRLINRGSVRIQKNNNLCYLNRINWNWLSSYTKHPGFEKKVIAENGDPSECVNRCGDESCVVDGQAYCWGLGLCQKKPCPQQCGNSCRETRAGPRCDCHKECLAGCTRPNDPTACLACKNKYHNGTCLDKCPADMHLIHGWLCITKEVCQRLDWHFYSNDDVKFCQLQCPAGYQVVVRDCMNFCEECNSDCGKVCLGSRLVTDHYDLVNVETCKEITGTLTITINGGSEFVKGLDNAFKDLEQIGSLVVRSSHPLVSLSFLRNVKRITGESMRDNDYSVYVLGNQNLKELWDFKRSNLTIAKGKAFFHFNPHLCRQEIDKVEVLTKPVEDDKDISETTNGDRAVCEIDIIKILDVHMFPKASENEQVVKILWENAEIKDFRTLIGYQVLYKESPDQDAKKLQGVDACGHTSWTIVDKPKDDDSFTTAESSNVNVTISNETLDLPIGPSEPGSTYKLLTDLKAYTQYAFYVHAYTTSIARRGAESEIQYFKTKPAVPSSPQTLRADGATTSTITVIWEAPLKPNGIITHYIVEWRRQTEEDLMRVRSVDSCKGTVSLLPSDPPVSDTTTVKPDETKDTSGDKKTENEQGQCTCDCDQISDEKEKLAVDSAKFENFLQDHIFPSIQDLPYGDSPGYFLREDYHGSYPVNGTDYDDYGTVSRSKRSLTWGQRLRRSLQNGSLASNTTSQPSTASSTTTPSTDYENDTTTMPPETGTTAAPEDPEYTWNRMVVNTTQAVINGLHHFSEYDIMVYACNHASDPRTKTDLKFKVRAGDSEHSDHSYYTKCSIEAITSKRTAKNASVDIIPRGSLNVTAKEGKNTKGKSEEVIEFTWKMPVDPNAYIRTFTIRVLPIDSGDLNQGKNFCVHVNSSVKDVMSYAIRSGDLFPGKYEASVRPTSLAGDGQWTSGVNFEMVNPTKSDTSIILAIVLAVLIGLGLVCVGLVIYLCKTRKKAPDTQQMYTDLNPEYSNFIYIPDEYEVDEENVTILDEIGHGNFGKVFAGLAKSVIRGQDETKVAIKKLHENAAPSRRYEFLKEASLMKAFNAHHVVRLLGVVSRTIDPMVIMEFMEKGDLKSYLRSTREGAEENTQNLVAPSEEEKMQMAAEIADGMAYLADNKFVHRDLAARNCLVHASGTVKIGDFGLTRDIYETDYYRKESRGFLPIRWMAPESLKDGVFDARSDVWSYGVVLWELATLAEQPYQGLQHDQVTRFVIDGGYMECPRDCPKRLYDLMTTCWQYNPKMRPDFLEIVQVLYHDVNAEFKEVCFYGKQQGANVGDDQDIPFLLPGEHSSCTDPYLPNDIHLGFPGSQTSREMDSVEPYWHAADSAVRYVKAGSGRPGGMALRPPHAESEEKRGLLQPTPDHLSPALHGDSPCQPTRDNRSPNTTSTTAASPISSGDGRTHPRRYSSDSQYENDYDDREPTEFPNKDHNLEDSGTFVTLNNKNPKSEALDPLIAYTHLNGGHKSKKPANLELDLESGVEEGNWANSSTTSASNPATPTETEAMLGSGKNELSGGNRLLQMLRPQGPTSSSC